LARSADATGLRLWGMAECVSRYLTTRRDLFEGRDVIELGAGCGMCSLAVGCTAACSSLVVTDGSEEAVKLCSMSIDLNEGKLLSAVSAHQLVWTVEGTAPPLVGCPEHFDAVIGTDLIYHQSCCDALLATVVRLLKPDGIFVLAFHSRVQGSIAELTRCAIVHGLLSSFVDPVSMLRAAYAGDACDLEARAVSVSSGFVVCFATEPAALRRFVGEHLEPVDAPTDDWGGDY
jgi:predicted nicotinamide N-methyase